MIVFLTACGHGNKSTVHHLRDTSYSCIAADSTTGYTVYISGKDTVVKDWGANSDMGVYARAKKKHLPADSFICRSTLK